MAISPTLSRVPTPPMPRDITEPLAAVPTASASPTPEESIPAQPKAIQEAPITKPDETARTSRKTILDQSTGELIFQVIDDHTGQKISQSPEEAMLRMRAYARQMGASNQLAPGTFKAEAKG